MYLAQKYQVRGEGHYFTSPTEIQATQRSSRLQDKGSTFISQLFLSPATGIERERELTGIEQERAGAYPGAVCFSLVVKSNFILPF